MINQRFENKNYPNIDASVLAKFNEVYARQEAQEAERFASIEETSNAVVNEFHSLTLNIDTSEYQDLLDELALAWLSLDQKLREMREVMNEIENKGYLK